MDKAMWIIWLALGAVLIVAEIFTLGFVLFWFGVGALAAAAAGYFGMGVAGQFLIFAVVSIALTAMSRTIFAKYLPSHDGDRLKTGAEALPGKVGTVIGSSKGALNEGAVKVFGSTWTAYPIDDETLVEGEKVEVVEVKGSSIYVRKVTGKLPSWREE
ncbi:MAG: NfeD family protein [Acidobacteria bacterium]|nr:NfeD family protein [Acidobacteriota bacterium]